MPLFSVDLGQLSRLRDFVTESAAALGVDVDAHDDLRVAVDETVTNIIIHGYGGAGEVSIDLEADGKDLVVRIADAAPPFDPTTRVTQQLKPLDERAKPGGLGIFMVNKAMDEVRYAREKGKNVLVMIKRNVVAA